MGTMRDSCNGFLLRRLLIDRRCALAALAQVLRNKFFTAFAVAVVGETPEVVHSLTVEPQSKVHQKSVGWLRPPQLHVMPLQLYFALNCFFETNMPKHVH